MNAITRISICVLIFIVAVHGVVYAQDDAEANSDMGILSKSRGIYTEIVSKVETGKLPESAQTTALEYLKELETQLVRLDAKIAEAEVTLRYSTAADNTESLEEIKRLVSEKERTKYEYFSKLEDLNNALPAGKAAASGALAAETQTGKKQADEDANYTTKELDWEIKVTPEKLPNPVHD